MAYIQDRLSKKSPSQNFNKEKKNKVDCVSTGVSKLIPYNFSIITAVNEILYSVICTTEKEIMKKTTNQISIVTFTLNS